MPREKPHCGALSLNNVRDIIYVSLISMTTRLFNRQHPCNLSEFIFCVVEAPLACVYVRPRDGRGGARAHNYTGDH